MDIFDHVGELRTARKYFTLCFLNADPSPAPTLAWHLVPKPLTGTQGGGGGGTGVRKIYGFTILQYSCISWKHHFSNPETGDNKRLQTQDWETWNNFAWQEIRTRDKGPKGKGPETRVRDNNMKWGTNDEEREIKDKSRAARDDIGDKW